MVKIVCLILKKKYLKDFLIENPPTFKISNQCCDYAKKKLAHEVLKEGRYDLSCIGVRKAEGGVRSHAYKNCYDQKDNEVDRFRPIFWLKKADKDCYEKYFGLVRSECYTKYGLPRTGCCGCPYGKDFQNEREVIKTYEPKLYKAINAIFGDSYEYTQRYKDYVKKREQEEKEKYEI